MSNLWPFTLGTRIETRVFPDIGEPFLSLMFKEVRMTSQTDYANIYIYMSCMLYTVSVHVNTGYTLQQMVASYSVPVQALKPVPTGAVLRF